MAEWLGWSPTVHLLWWIRDQLLQQEIEAARRAANEHAADSTGGYRATGPPFDWSDPKASFERIIEVWSRSSLLMHRITVASGARYYHLLQPNQYDPGSKPLLPEERARAYDPESKYRPVVESGYPLLRAEGRELVEAGVRFVDLSMAFHAVSEPLYLDHCCHFDQRGSEILAGALVAEIRRDLER